jgi:hypothetical protein
VKSGTKEGAVPPFEPAVNEDTNVIVVGARAALPVANFKLIAFLTSYSIVGVNP